MMTSILTLARKQTLFLAALTLAALGLALTLGAPVAQADQSEFYLDCPRTEIYEGFSVDVYLVRVDDHQHSVYFWADWYTSLGTAEPGVDLVQVYGLRQESTQAETNANRMKATFHTVQDDKVEGDEYFYIYFLPDANVLDPNDPAKDNKCKITILDDDPRITDLEITSTPSWSSDTYGLGEIIEVTATFNSEVDADEEDGIEIQLGDERRTAYYVSGSGTKELKFHYRVYVVEADADGISVFRGDQASAHRGMKAKGTDDNIHPWFEGIGNQSGHKVNGSLRPKSTGIEFTSTPATGGGTYRYGESIDIAVSFTVPLHVVGEPFLALAVGEVGSVSDPSASPSYREAEYVSGNNTKTLNFSYEVEGSDLDANGISIYGTWRRQMHYGGVIEGGINGRFDTVIKGTSIFMNPDMEGVTDKSGHAVDGRPYVKGLDITSDAGDDKTFAKGDKIELEATFDQDVDVDETAGDLELDIQIGDNTRAAAYKSGSGSDALKFEYVVGLGDSDSNGISVPSGTADTSLGGSSAVIKASGSRVAFNPNFGGFSDREEHKVDAIPPRVTSFGILSLPYNQVSYNSGEWIAVYVNFDEDVEVTGEPALMLSIGEDDRTAGYQPSDNNREEDSRKQLLFGYMVQQGDLDEDGFSIGADNLYLNGGTIRDAVGNDADLSHDALGSQKPHKVDGVDDITSPAIESIKITSDPGDDDTYGEGDTISVAVKFSEVVAITGTPQIELVFDGDNKKATFISLLNDTATFQYDIAVGDVAANGLGVAANSLNLKGGTIQDAGENNANLAHPGLDSDAEHIVMTYGGL